MELLTYLNMEYMYEYDRSQSLLDHIVFYDESHNVLYSL